MATQRREIRRSVWAVSGELRMVLTKNLMEKHANDGLNQYGAGSVTRLVISNYCAILIESAVAASDAGRNEPEAEISASTLALLNRWA